MEFQVMQASAGRPAPTKPGPSTAATAAAPRRPGESDEMVWGRPSADTLDTISEMPERHGPVNNGPSRVSDGHANCVDRRRSTSRSPSSLRGVGVADKYETESGTPPVASRVAVHSEPSPIRTSAASPSRAPAASTPVVPVSVTVTLRPRPRPRPRPRTPDKIAEQEDALSADEGIQTSPPFESDEPWDLPVPGGGEEAAMTAVAEGTPRRYSMSALQLLRSPRRLTGEASRADEEEDAAPARSPAKNRLAEEIKARRWRYRPKSCSLPHLDWLKQRTESTLDRSAEMQRRTAELIQNAKTAREQEV